MVAFSFKATYCGVIDLVGHQKQFTSIFLIGPIQISNLLNLDNRGMFYA